MSKFLLIESSTADCSVALSEDQKLIDLITVDKPRAHASLLAPCIDEILKKNHMDISELTALSVSRGPGSYTGLRVGVSVAKGICFGRKIPLLSVSTLDILVQMAFEHIRKEKALIIPMIDARRMEVYTACYDARGKRLDDINAKILDEHSYDAEFGTYDQLIFIGDGAEKYKTLLNEEQLRKSVFIGRCPSASGMVLPTFEAYQKSEFEDTAYFEPFYLKSFVAGISKKSLL